MNPYIGARPFRRNETIYGRAREARDLLSLLVGDRIVLLNSPSGAGKTSLIQAALIPRLEQRRFAVRPTIRIGAPSPVPGANRYLLSAMQSLEDARPAAEQLAPEALADLTLDAYLAQRAGTDAAHGQVLIFDQFEEVLTLDPSDEPARLAFFEQLGDALADPWRWALFAIREEYVAALEPYTNLVPTRFANTFRLGLLGVEAACDAISGPARSRQVDFDAAAAEALASNLAKIVVQDAEGRPVERTGISVEPVQLQVVCYRLWERRFPDAAAVDVAGQLISAADVQAIGSIDDALEEYYNSGVAKAVAAGQVRERAVRAWFDTQLITRQGFRSQILQGGEEAFGLNDASLAGLTNAYLVREERRRGVTWLELAHDRLIAPVRVSNTRWFAANLSPLQRQAEIWAAQGQPASLLFRDAELTEAEAWAAANADGLTDDEQLFLENCREERRRAEERARQARRIRNLAIGASIAAVLAVVAAFAALGLYGQANANYAQAVSARATSDANYAQAESNRQTAIANEQLAQTQQAIAERNARVSQVRELAAASLNQIDTDPELAVLLGMRAVQVSRPDDPEVPEAADALQQAANSSRVTRTITLPGQGTSTAYSSDGRYLATAVDRKQVMIWDLDASAQAPRTISPSAAGALTVAFDPTRPVLAVGDRKGILSLWNLADTTLITSTSIYSNNIGLARLSYSHDGSKLALGGVFTQVLVLDTASLQLKYALPHKSGVLGVAFSRDGTMIATASIDTTARLWDAASGSPISSTIPHAAPLSAIALSPGGDRLVTGDIYGTLYVWDISNPQAPKLISQLRSHSNTIFSIAFSPSGDWLASASADTQVRLWDLNGGRTIEVLAGHSGGVYGMSFRPDGQSIATSSADSRLKIWRLGLIWPSAIQSVAFSPDGARVASASGKTAHVWSRETGDLLLSLNGHDGQINRVAYSADGTLIATASADGSARLWDATSGALRMTFSQVGEINDMALSADGARASTVGEDKIVHLWDVASGRELDPPGKIESEYPLTTVAFSPNSQYLASGNTVGKIWLWDLRAGRQIDSRIGFSKEIKRLVFSPDSTRLAVAGTTQTPMIFRLDSPDTPIELKGHTANAVDIAFSADGSLLATVGADKSLRIWRSDGSPLSPRWSLPANPNQVAMRPDGREVAIGGSDGVVRLVPLALSDLLDFARTRVSRAGLTDDECKTYLHQQRGCSP